MSEELRSHAVVISPHQDDAAISLGDHLLKYPPGNVHVVNIFTHSNSHMLAGVSDDPDVVSPIRAAEDQRVADQFRYNFTDLGLSDSEIRGTEWNDHDAPIDPDVLQQAADRIAGHLGHHSLDLYIPAGFGLHPDHYLALLACSRSALIAAIRDGKIIPHIYAEQPYYLEGQAHHNGHALLDESDSTEHAFNEATKLEMLSAYPSQLTEERVRMLMSIGVERFWRLNADDYINFILRSFARKDEGQLRTFGTPDLLSAVQQAYESPERKFDVIEVKSAEGHTINVPITFEAFRMGDRDVMACRCSTIYMADYMDFEGIDQFDAHALEQLKAALREKGGQILWLSNVRRDTSIAELFQEQLTRPDVIHVDNISTYGADCAFSFEDWLSTRSKNARRSIRRKMRAMSDYCENETNSKPEFTVSKAEPRDVERLLQLQSERARLTGNLADFSQDPHYSSLIRNLVNVDNVYVAKLSIGSEDASMLLLFVDNVTKTIGIYMQGFDSRWTDLSPSFCAMSYLMEYAHEHGFRYVDFLRGDETYKSNFVNRQIQLDKYVFILDDEVDKADVEETIGAYEE